MDLAKLDHYEGLGFGSVHKAVAVQMTDGSTMTALSYAARPSFSRSELAPSDWHHSLVVAGALNHSLPSDYFEGLEIVRASQTSMIKGHRDCKPLNCWTW